jgi:SAM-dependent methyltransferase
VKRRALLRGGGAALLAAAALPRGAAWAQAPDVPYVPTPQAVVDEMLRLARVGAQDYVIDLGCGDGRIVIAAAKAYGARGFGVDLDGGLVNTAQREAERQGVAARALFRQSDLFVTDIGEATVLTMYLYPSVNLQLRPRLFELLKPGTRVVSHDFDMGEWQPDERATVPVPGKRYGPPRSEIYLWIVPANAAGAWRWELAVAGIPVACEIALEQRFQVLAGKPLTGGAPGRLEDGKMRGEEIRLRLVAPLGGREVRHELSGRVAGDAIAGTARLDGGGELVWNAARAQRGNIVTSSN